MKPMEHSDLEVHVRKEPMSETVKGFPYSSEAIAARYEDQGSNRREVCG